MTQSKTAFHVGAALCRGLILSAALIVALSARAQESQTHKSKDHAERSGDAASCIKHAAQMNMATIKFGQLGADKAQNADLKQFSALIQRDHQKAQEKLANIAKAHHVELPTALDDKCQEELTRLQGLSGSEFDKEFAKGAVQGHAMGIAHLKESSSQLKEGDLAQYTQDMLAQLKRHQQMGREVAKAVGLDQATIASLETPPRDGVGTPGASTQTDRGSSSKTPSETTEKETPRQP